MITKFILTQLEITVIVTPNGYKGKLMHHFDKAMSNRGERRYRVAGEGLEPVIGPYERYHELLRGIASDLAKNLSDAMRRVDELAPKLRDVLPIFELRAEDASSVRIAAVDAGSNGKDLVLGYQPVSVAVGAVFTGTLKDGDPVVATVKPPKSYFDDEEGSKFSSLLGYYLMYRLGVALLEKSDVLILDGPLFLPRNYYGPKGRAHTRAYYEVYDAALRSLGELLRTARSTGRKVVGVVKRIRSSYIYGWLGIGGYPDPMLASSLLREGEALGPIPINPRWEDVLTWLDDTRPYRPWSVFFRRGSRPTRIDIPEYAIDDSEWLASVLYSVSEPVTGLPIPLIAVDRLSKLTDRQASLVYRMMLSEMGCRDPDRVAMFSLQRGESD